MNWSVIGGPRGGMLALTWPFVFFVCITFATCTAESTGFEDVGSSQDLADQESVSEALLALLFSTSPASDAQEMIPSEPEESRARNPGAPKRLYYAPRPGKRNTDLYQDEEAPQEERRQQDQEGQISKGNKRSAQHLQEDQGGREKRQAPQHDKEGGNDDVELDDSHSWWWPFLTVRRSPFSPRLGKRGDDLADREFAADDDDDDDLADAEYFGDDLQAFLTEAGGSEVLVDKRGMGFSPRLGKRTPGFAFSPRLGKRAAAFPFSPRPGKREDFAFSPRLGKKSDFTYSPRPDKKGNFAFRPRLGKKADFAFSPRLGKKADFAFSPRLGKKADFAFSPRLGKKADFAFSPRLGKRADFAFSPRLGKKADFAFIPRLGKRKNESTLDTRNTRGQPAFIPRLGRAYFSPRLG